MFSVIDLLYENGFICNNNVLVKLYYKYMMIFMLRYILLDVIFGIVLVG